MTNNSYITKPNNVVTIVPRSVVIKEYQSKDGALREYLSLSLLRNLNITNVPRILGSSKGLTVLENITGSIAAYDYIQKYPDCKTIVMEQIALYISKVVANYNSKKNNILVPKFMQFDYLLENLVKDFSYYKEPIIKTFSKTFYSKINADLKLLSNSSNVGTVSLIHSDLHLSNLLIKQKKCTQGDLNLGNMYVIDYEAACLGPIELEFQNSLFWNDAKSLDVALIVKALKKTYGIKYNKSLELLLGSYYVGSQVVCAFKNTDNQKIELIKSVPSLTRYLRVDN